MMSRWPLRSPGLTRDEILLFIVALRAGVVKRHLKTLGTVELPDVDIGNHRGSRFVLDSLIVLGGSDGTCVVRGSAG